jgi:FecR protein
VTSAHFVAGGPNLQKPLGLFFAEIRNRVAFRLLYQHFAARTEADRDVKRGDGGGDRMSLVKRVIAALLLTGAAALLLASSTLAQERVGVVTNIEGFATVARVALPEPKPLHFKDDLFLRDRITTGERSMVRVLLGGKATVTARERSVLTITEVPGLATINLGAGRIAVAVAKGLMKPGEVIQIKTPNAVTAIRGTVVIAEVEPVPQGYQSTITILRGLVDVTKLDPAGALTGPAVKVGVLERVTVVDARPVPAPQKITRETASALAADFSLVPKNAPAASTDALSAEVKEITMRDAMQIIGAVTTTPTGSGSSTSNQGVTGGVTAAIGGVTNTVTDTVDATTSGLSNLANGTTNTLTTVTGGATGTLNGVTGAATGAVTGLTSPVTQPVAPVVNPVTSPVTNLVTTVTNTVNNVTNPILPGLLRKP